MSKNYDYLVLAGDDKDVYKYIAPYAMDSKIIRLFDGYPIFTGKDYVWFLVFSGKKLIAWASLKVFKNKVLFVNDYVEPDYRHNGIHTELIHQRIDWCEKQGYFYLEVDCLDTAINQYKKVGFKEIKTFTKWHKLEMEIVQPEEIE